MKPNSNTNITNYTVDPITQQITSLEVNGEAIELSPEPGPTPTSNMFYAFKGSNNKKYCYCKSETPAIGDTVYYAVETDNSNTPFSAYFEKAKVLDAYDDEDTGKYAVITDVEGYDSLILYRYPDKDIDFS